MRLCRFEPNRFGVIEGETVADVTELVLGSLPPLVYPVTAGDPVIAALPSLLPKLREAAAKAPRKPLAEVRLLSPVGMPGKIIGAPANYMKHVAEVAADGPFSTFEGIDRTLVLLEGDGVELVVSDRSTILSKARPMLSFDGEAATYSHLLSGPVRDLNIMTRRGRVSHDVAAPPLGLLAPRSAHWLVFALGGDVTVTIDGTPFRLDRFDLLVTQGSPSNASLNGHCWLIELHHEQSS